MIVHFRRFIGSWTDIDIVEFSANLTALERIRMSVTPTNLVPDGVGYVAFESKLFSNP